MISLPDAMAFTGFAGQVFPRVRLPNKYQRVYPFGWLGILAEAPPSSDELVYSYHDRGFALLSMRTQQLQPSFTCSANSMKTSRTGPTSGSGRNFTLASPVKDWALTEGPIDPKGYRPACGALWLNPCSTARLFLAGDAAHIVPPTGAKGLNLAVADVRVLARAMSENFTVRQPPPAR